MLRKMGFTATWIAFLLLSSPRHLSAARSFESEPPQSQSIGAQPTTADIDEHDRITLKGNTRPEARRENDRGKVDANFAMQHMLLQLKRMPEQEEALKQFLDELHVKDSPNFHKWITAREFAKRFGVAKQDRQTVIRWLESHGLTVNVDYPSGMLIDFSGSAEAVQSAFGTEIHELEVKGKKHYANMQDPQIPRALASVIAGVVSLNDFHPRPLHKLRTPQFTFPDIFGGETNAVVPADLATIYNINPLFNAGITGKGQTIVLIEDTNVFTPADWNSFRATFGLAGYTSASFTSVHPAPASGTNNCSDPGIIAPNDAEAILDAEWASAAAPNAAILIASCADTTTTFGGLIAMENLINSSQPPSIVSISYGQCETVNGAAANAAYNSAYQQAVAEGASIFVAAGDSGAAGCDNSVAEATHGIAANAFASTPYNVAVGGTDFGDTYAGTNSLYWNSANTSTFASAKSYIPEIPWNDSCAGGVLSAYEGLSTTYGSTSLCNDPFLGSFLASTVAGGGGPSGCATGSPSTPDIVSGSCQGWPKPVWQSVLGNPGDGVRDTPDVSLFAADGLWGHYYVFCWSDTANGGAACTADPSAWSGAGGTSFSAPIMAGVQALINQKLGAPQGNPNPVYYRLANLQYGGNGSTACNASNGAAVAANCIFYDVTFGDIDVDCVGSANCYFGDGAVGVLSTSNSAFAPAYGTNTGWDFSTGLGTVNVANLVNNWPGSGPNFFLSASPASLSVVQGASGTSTITLAPQNGFNDNVSLSASGLPSGITASFNPGSTTSSSTLTLAVSNTAATGTTNVTVVGTSGNLTSTTSVSLTVKPAPSFTVSASPAALIIHQGASGVSTITVTPQNGFNGSVSLTASGLPSGVTASFNPSTTGSSSTLTLMASSAAALGTASVNITGTSGSLSNSTTVALTIKTVTLPTGWTDADVGAVSTPGDASYGNGSFTIKAAGAQIYGTADAMHWAYQPLSGDGTIVARVVSVQGGANFATAGVMIREALDAGSRNAKTADWPAYSAIYFDLRTSPGGTTTEPGSSRVVATLPYWVKLVRSGNSFSSYASADGNQWTQIGLSQTVAMSANVYIGLAANSGSSSLATATFDNVAISKP